MKANQTREEHFKKHGYDFPIPQVPFNCLSWNRETISGDKQAYKVVVDDIDYGDLEVFARTSGPHSFVVCEAGRSGVTRELLQSCEVHDHNWTGNLKFSKFLEAFENPETVVSELFYDMSIVVVLKEQVHFSDVVILRVMRQDAPGLILNLMCNALVHSVSWTGYARNFVYADCLAKTIRIKDYEKFYLLESAEDQFSRINSLIDTVEIVDFVTSNDNGWSINE